MSVGDCDNKEAPDTSIDPRLIEGIDLFNRKEFFDCHEILEDLWNDQQEPEKQLTQGIIQIAVAYYHVLQENRVGAIKLLNRGIPRVQPFLPEFKKILLQAFLDDVEKDRESISAGADTSLLILPQINFAAPKE